MVSDDHQGLRKSLMEILPEAAWQRCYVHFLRNALDPMPRKANDDCLQELGWQASSLRQTTLRPGLVVTNNRDCIDFNQ